MTIGKVIKLADAMKPNAIGREQKYQYINEVEGLVQSEVMLLVSDDIVTYDCDATGADDTVLLVKPPHDKLYIAYLVAMIDYANGEYNKYANTIEQFNTYYAEYHRWYFKHFHPADGECVERGYYLSAYTLAVLHGFVGDEDAFVASMVGKSPEMRYTADGKKLEWKYTTEGDGEWRELLDASEIKGDKGDKGDAGSDGAKGDKGDKGDTGAQGAKGDKGDAFTYDDFTAEQLAALKGEKGDKGDKGEPGDGGGGYSFTITKSGSTYSADKTFAEITAAISAGKIIRAMLLNTNGSYYVFALYYQSSDYLLFEMVNPAAGNNVSQIIQMYCTSQDVWKGGTINVESQSRMTQTISDSPSEAKYTSEKAVADYVTAQLGDVVSLINAI